MTTIVNRTQQRTAVRVVNTSGILTQQSPSSTVSTSRFPASLNIPSIHVGPTAPLDPEIGDLWVDTSA